MKPEKAFFIYQGRPEAFTREAHQGQKTRTREAPGPAESQKERRDRMKCKRCGHDMRREKVGPGSYRYRCGYCGLIVAGPAESQEKEKSPDEGKG